MAIEKLVPMANFHHFLDKSGYRFGSRVVKLAAGNTISRSVVCSVDCLPQITYQFALPQRFVLDSEVLTK